MTAQTVIQAIASGLLMGLIYALIAAGLSLIFGLMEIVNFAHGEFVMVAMYTSFGLFIASGLDPLLLVPATAGFLFILGYATYRLLIARALRTRTNVGMAQVFVTFGLAIFLRGMVQLLWTPGISQHQDLLDERDHLPRSAASTCRCHNSPPRQSASPPSPASRCMINRTDFGRAIEATREDSEAVGLVGIDRHRIFALGWGIGAATVGVAGGMLATFYYIYPDVGATFALIAYVTVALGGFGSIVGALAAGVIIGLVEALSALVVEPSLKQIGVYLLYMIVVLIRPRGLFGNF